MPDRDMTTDKPGEAAMEAAQVIDGSYKTAINESFGTTLQSADKETMARMAAIIQAAIDEATAKLRAERDRSKAIRIEYAEKVSAARDERDRARAALAPFAAFADLPSMEKMPDDFVVSAGSRFAAPQLTAADCRRARAALLAEPEGGG